MILLDYINHNLIIPVKRRSPMEEQKKRKKKVIRSPGYPMISLEEALQKTNILWEKEKSNPIPKEVALKHLGYKTTLGYSARILSALKQFDLILEEKGDIKLTQNAIDLSIFNPSDDDYNNLLKKIALYPNSYSKIYNEYNGNIPSDDTLRIKLIRDYGFNVDKVQKFLSAFRATINFVHLTNDESGNRLIHQEEIQERTQKLDQTISTQQNRQIFQEGQSFPIPFSNRNKVTILFDKLPVQKEDLEKMKKWIDLFGDSLTEEESS